MPDTNDPGLAGVSADVDQMMLAAQQAGSDTLTTGRYIVTFKQDALDQGLQEMSAQGVRNAADARDFDSQAVNFAEVAGSDAVVFPEIGSALVSGTALADSGLRTAEADSAIQAIEPEYFAFALTSTVDYLQGFRSAVEAIIDDLGVAETNGAAGDVDAEVLGATWGLRACRVPQSSRSGSGIKVAVLDTGMDLHHPDFAGRPVIAATFVGQPVQDLHSHGTHCIGTATGPLAPGGSTPRYGIGYRARIFAGKVLSNSGSGSTAGVLAGMNWAVANRCEVISMSLGSASPVQAAYTAAGQAALNRGCLIVAAAGNDSGPTGAPANSPTIFAVASLDANLKPSSFSSKGKIEIAAPGRDVFSSVPMPVRYGIKSGTSMATPHVAGCAALWAQTSANLRGPALWKKLQATAKSLPFPPASVGAGLVQAP
jgi:subtilisin family serine protease